MTALEAVKAAVQRLAFGSPTTFENLTLIHVIAPDERDPDYLTLDEGLAGGHVRITEVDEHESVPELKIVNSGHAAVFLLDGEELLGARQNRVVNLSMLIPGHQTTVIPVSCVESGRWHHVSRQFVSVPRTQFAEGRAAKMRQVTRSMQAAGTRVSDQTAVWSLIAEKSARLGAVSDTSAMSAMYERADRPIEEFVQAFPPIDRQVGALFAINGRPAGFECFDTPGTWCKLSSKLLRSYALDALDRRPHKEDNAIAVDGTSYIANIVESEGTAFPATGEGEDVRLGGDKMAGAALVARGRVIHLSAFPQL